MPDLRATVTEIYQAFNRGEIPTMLDRLTRGVASEHWAAWIPRQPGAPWLQPRGGPAGAADFFAISRPWTSVEFQVVDLMVSGSQVTARVEVQVRVPGGTTIREEATHLWTFDDDGNVIGCRDLGDAARRGAAARAEASD